MTHVRVHVVGDGEKVHPGAAASGAGDDLHVVFTDAHGCQNLFGRQHLLHGVAGEAHPNGVADAIHEKAPDAGGGFDEARLAAARFSDAHVKGVVRQLVKTAHGRHGVANAGMLHGKYRVVKALGFQKLHVVEGALHHGFHRIVRVVRPVLLVERAPVHPDADGDMVHLTAVHHRLHPVGRADVPRVDAELFAAVLHGGDGQPIVEVHVRHQGDMDFIHDIPESLRRILIEDGGADDFTACRLQTMDLGHGGRRVPGIGVGHGLDGDGSAATHGHGVDENLSRHRITRV